jgi:hypothetical protein
MKSEMQQHEIWYEINLFLVEVNNLQICLEQMQRALHAKYVEFLSYGPLTVILLYKLIMRPAEWFEFDMPALGEICQ